MFKLACYCVPWPVHTEKILFLLHCNTTFSLLCKFPARRMLNFVTVLIFRPVRVKMFLLWRTSLLPSTTLLFTLLICLESKLNSQIELACGLTCLTIDCGENDKRLYCM